jgi:hypothetical protein
MRIALGLLGLLVAAFLSIPAAAFPHKLYRELDCIAANRGRSEIDKKMGRFPPCSPKPLPPGARVIDGSVVMPWPSPGYARPRGSWFDQSGR